MSKRKEKIRQVLRELRAKGHPEAPEDIVSESEEQGENSLDTFFNEDQAKQFSDQEQLKTNRKKLDRLLARRLLGRGRD